MTKSLKVSIIKYASASKLQLKSNYTNIYMYVSTVYYWLTDYQI